MERFQQRASLSRPAQLFGNESMAVDADALNLTDVPQVPGRIPPGIPGSKRKGSKVQRTGETEQTEA